MLLSLDLLGKMAKTSPKLRLLYSPGSGTNCASQSTPPPLVNHFFKISSDFFRKKWSEIMGWHARRSIPGYCQLQACPCGRRCGSGILSGGGPGFEAESCRCSEAESCERSEQCVAGFQGLLKGPGSFWVLIAQICILPHCRDSFSPFEFEL